MDATSETVQWVKTMNTGEKIDYMIQCLQVAKAEYEYEAERYAHERAEDYEWLNKHHITNKALTRENLRNVARMGFQVANEVNDGIERTF